MAGWGGDAIAAGPPRTAIGPSQEWLENTMVASLAPARRTVFRAAATISPERESGSGAAMTRVHLMGRDIASEFPLRALPPAATDRASVEVRSSRSPLPPSGRLVRAVHDESGAPRIRVYEGSGGIRYWARGIGAFWIAPDGTRVLYRLEDPVRPLDVEQILTGPVLGLALQQQGDLLLHAGAVVVDGAAAAFAAPHGWGKSTLTASFVRAGHAMLTDDILPLSWCGTGVVVHPSVPRIKLWEDSLGAFGEDEGDHRPVLSWLDKRRVEVGSGWGSVAAERVPLASLYLLAPHADAGAPIEIAALEPADAALQLVANMYMAEMSRGERAARSLTAAARLASIARVRRLSYCRTYENLSAIRAAVIADMRAGSPRR
jgi:hypothetical protein